MTFLLNDLEEFFNKCHTRFWQRYRQHKAKEITVWTVQSNVGVTDANGNLTVPIYKNTSGKHLAIGRIFLNAVNPATKSPYTGATTYTNANAYAWFFTGDPQMGANQLEIFDFLPNSPDGQMFPQVAEYSGHNALRLKKNETFSMQLVSGPASSQVFASIFGYLEPTATDWES